MHKCALCMCVLWLGLSQQQQGGDVVVVVGGLMRGESEPTTPRHFLSMDRLLAGLSHFLALTLCLSLPLSF